MDDGALGSCFSLTSLLSSAAQTVAFSKFDFGNEKKKPKGRPTPQQLLQKVEQQHKRMKELEKEDAAKAGDIAEKAAWAKAMQRAEGEKVGVDELIF